MTKQTKIDVLLIPGGRTKAKPFLSSPAATFLAKATAEPTAYLN